MSRDAYASEIPVSQGKSAVASSVTGATYSASQAVDGFIHTKWVASNSQLPQWLTVDLSQNAHVSRVETVFEHVNSSYAYKIESSLDGINWSIFADRSTNTVINSPYYSDSGDVLARFVRLQVVGVGSPGDQASVFDFRVYSTSEALTLLSQNKTTAALTSFSGSWGSDKAVDGQLLSSWAPSSTSLPQWLVVDLGQLRNVQRFETTYSNIQDIYSYKIDFSIDGLAWYTFTDRTGNMQAGDPRYVDEGNVTARYFRLTTTRIASGGYASVAEFPGSTGFQDIKERDWYSQMVNTAAKAGLIEGFEDGTFRPLLQVTREQMATMINRTIQITGSKQESYEQDTVLNPFIDQHAIDNWARQAMAFTLQTGLIQGVTETQLNPNAFATRAQAAVMLKRLLIYLQYIN